LRLIASLVLVALFVTSSGAARAQDVGVTAPGERGPVIELALCLDVSGSMKPSLDAAKAHLWTVVEDVIGMDPAPVVRVALLTYGGSRNPEATGYIRTEMGLTEDLDAVYEKLDALESQGAIEFVGRVIRSAVSGLGWSEEDDAVRIVFVIGNESAEQDPELDLAQLAHEALDRDIAVHPIFVGSERSADFESWRRLAEFAEVAPERLDAGRSKSAPSSPYDEKLAALGKKLDATIVNFPPPEIEAASGSTAPSEAADELPANEGAVAKTGAEEKADPALEASRAVARARMLERRSRDLVAAADAGQIDPWEIPAEQLPDELRSMTPSERASHLFDLAEERRELIAEINELGGKRAEHLAALPGDAKSGSLSSLVIRAVRERAGERGME
jgi:hypothetical protein